MVLLPAAIASCKREAHLMNLCLRCSANPCKKGETQARSRQCLRNGSKILPALVGTWFIFNAKVPVGNSTQPTDLIIKVSSYLQKRNRFLIDYASDGGSAAAGPGLIRCGAAAEKLK